MGGSIAAVRSLVTGASVRTDNLVLRRPMIWDSARLNAAIVESLDDLQRWLKWPSKHRFVTTLRYILESFNGFRTGRLLMVIVLVPGSPQRVAGVITLHNIRTEERRADLGYWIRPRLRLNGIATEAAGHVTALGFNVLGLTRIDSLVSTENIGSRRVLERLGFASNSSEGSACSACVRFTRFAGS